jgi:hypothetical protein
MAWTAESTDPKAVMRMTGVVGGNLLRLFEKLQAVLPVHLEVSEDDVEIDLVYELRGHGAVAGKRRRRNLPR